MKTMTILSLLTSSVAMANVADLNYRPKEGTFHLDSNLKFTKGEMTNKYSDNSSQDAEFETTNINTGISYGVLDNFSAGLTLGYDLVNTTETEDYAPTKANGLEDPTIEFSYRALENDPVTLDLNIQGLISIGDAEEDMAYKGGHVFTAGAQISKTIASLELMADLSIDYNFESKYKSEDSTTTYDPSINYTLDLSTQYQVSEFAYINAGLNYAIIGESESVHSANDNVPGTVEQYSIYTATAGVKFKPNEGLAFGLALTYSVYEDRKYSIEFPGSSYSVTNEAQNLVGLNLNTTYSF